MVRRLYERKSNINESSVVSPNHISTRRGGVSNHDVVGVDVEAVACLIGETPRHQEEAMVLEINLPPVREVAPPVARVLTFRQKASADDVVWGILEEDGAS